VADVIVPVPDAEHAFGAQDPGAASLAAAGYVTSEYLLSGMACGTGFTTRILLRHPEEAAVFSGIAVIEPMHFAGGRPVWATCREYLFRCGHAWAEVACQARPALEVLRQADERRYERVSLALADGAEGSTAGDGEEELRAEADAFISSWWATSPQLLSILGQAIRALRTGQMPIGEVRRVILAGVSQTGGIVRRAASAKAGLETANRPDGVLAMHSGGQALEDPAQPVIEMLAEADMESVRRVARLPGQARSLLHRQGDRPAFRLYEVAGMSHADSRYRRPPGRCPPGARWSRFPHTHITHAMLDALIQWVDADVGPMPGLVLDTEPDSGEVVRDELGHARGGIRAADTDFPLARRRVITPGPDTWPFGHEYPLTDREFTARYGSPATYLAAAGSRLEGLVGQRLVLADDAARWLEETQQAMTDTAV
jgi:Alpha/beta hydrolase domain